MSARRGKLVIVTLLGALMCAEGRALAEPASARLAFFPFGMRYGAGEFGEQYRWSWKQFGAEAALQPFAILPRRVRWGVAWWTMFGEAWGEQFTTDPTVASLQMGLGLRLEAQIPWLPAFDWHVLAGGEWVRYRLPVPPDGVKEYFGPKVGTGIEWGLGEFFLGAHVHYDLVTGGPTGLSGLAVAGFRRL